MDEGKRFLYFAFRQLRRIPPEWRSHYRYELVNQVQQSDPANHPSQTYSSRPLYWKLNHIKRGYHGVRWVLSRFDLECPEIPEMYRDPDAAINTNEGANRVYTQLRQREVFMPSTDEFIKPRTMSEAESHIVGRSDELRGVARGTRYGEVEPLEEQSVFMESAFPHRMIDPQDMTEEDLQDDEFEADYGGTLWGTSTGYPEGMGEGEAERDSTAATWHSNFSSTPNRETVENYAMTNPVDRKKWKKSMVSKEQTLEAEPGAPMRWVREPDGRWVRKAELPPAPPEGYTYPPPPGLGGNPDY